jgi:hypothetical protein
LPADAAEALERRSERIKVTTHDRDVTGHGYWRESRPFTIDLRRSC